MKWDPVFGSKMLVSLLFVAIFTIGYWDKLPLAAIWSLSTNWMLWRRSNADSTFTWPTVWFAGVFGFGIAILGCFLDLFHSTRSMMVLCSLIGPAMGLHCFFLERARRIEMGAPIPPESNAG